MAAKYYLDQEGLEKLVEYINLALDTKANKGEMPTLPTNIVKAEDLENYVLKTTLNNYATSQEVNDAIADKATNEDINALRMSLNNYATTAELDDYAPLSALDEYATNNDLKTLEGKVSGVYHYRGSVANLNALQAIENPAVGDVYNLEDTGMNAAWTGEVWDEFGTIVDLTDYAKTEDIQAISRSELNKIIYSGKTSVVNDFESIQAMLDNDEPNITLTFNKNLSVTSPITIENGKTVTIDLSGNTLDSTTIPVYANGGNVILKNGTVTSSSGAIVARNGSSIIVDNTTIISTGNNAISATDSSITVNSGEITAQEAGLLGLKNSNITINGGIVIGIDNCPMMGNGSPAGSNNDGTNMNVIMNGGKLIAHIQTAGYTACGVYVPNSGSFTMNGGEIISDGAGLVMRGGKVTLNGGKITANGTAGATGKVGDSRVVVGSYAVVYDANSKYPAMDSLELIVGKDMILEGTDGDIQTILSDGIEANITDNRN